MTRGGIPPVAYVLTALLAGSVLLLLFAREGGRAFPSIASSKPSGLRALAEILGNAGYDVVLEGASRPKLEPDDLAVTVQLSTQASPLDAPEGSPEERVQTIVKEHEWSGGAHLRLQIPGDFDERSRLAQNSRSPVRNPYGPKGSPPLHVQDLPETPFGIEASAVEDRVPLWVLPDLVARRTWAYVDTSSGARSVTLPYGLALTNRFIDRADHARIAAAIVAALAPEGGRVVFLEASFGNVREPSLLADLGPWAVAAQWQFLLLFVVVAYSLGKRFGLPDPGRVTERGARELVDAYATLMQRAKRRDLALRILADRAEARARSVLRLPVGASLSYGGRCPVSLLEALTIAREDRDWTTAEATSVAARLQQAVEDVERGRDRG